MTSGKGTAFFVDGPGGSGKTFLYHALLALVRSKGDVALAVVSSGVAARLLPGDRTEHSRFKLPRDIEESMKCDVSKQIMLVSLIISATLIIWNEASMTHRRLIESFNDLLQDLMNSYLPFGGKTIGFGGDFGQTIPIVIGGNIDDAIDACIVCSSIWADITKIHLVQNMRANDDIDYVAFLLSVGNGKESVVENGNTRLPQDMCISYSNFEKPLEELVSFVFPSFHEFYVDPLTVINRVILTPKNDCVDVVNEALIEKFPGNIVQYISADVADDAKQQSNYLEYMNSINSGNFPPHILNLKINSPITLLRNINSSEGLCNGTRLICKELGKHVIGAVIASGEHKGQHVLIPRIPLEPPDRMKCPLNFKRLQLPIKPCFAMTINK